jgi:hypothetical protein
MKQQFGLGDRLDLRTWVQTGETPNEQNSLSKGVSCYKGVGIGNTNVNACCLECPLARLTTDLEGNHFYQACSAVGKRALSNLPTIHADGSLTE